jgi:hypothetical protein
VPPTGDNETTYRERPPVVETYTFHSADNARKIELLYRKRVVVLPFASKLLQRWTGFRPDAGTDAKLFFVSQHGARMMQEQRSKSEIVANYLLDVTVLKSFVLPTTPAPANWLYKPVQSIAISCCIQPEAGHCLM